MSLNNALMIQCLLMFVDGMYEYVTIHDLHWKTDRQAARLI